MAVTTLPGVFQTVAPLLDSYGYFAVSLFLILEDFGVPVPGETILIAGAVYAGAGKLNVFALAILAILSAIIGDNIGFAIGHYGGERLVLKYGRYVFITPKRFDAAQAFFNRRGGIVIIVARFIEGLRQLNGIVAGTAEMKWRNFIIFNAIGATLWVSVWVSVGYLAGNHINAVYAQFKHYELYFLLLLGVGFIGLITKKIIKAKREARN